MPSQPVQLSQDNLPMGKYTVVRMCEWLHSLPNMASKIHEPNTVQKQEWVFFLLLFGCLTSQQHADVSDGWICSDNFTCCHAVVEATDNNNNNNNERISRAPFHVKHAQLH